MTPNHYQESEHQELDTSAHRALERVPAQENAMSGIPHVSPCTLVEAIQELPRQYVSVLIKPSVEKFTQEMGKARWSLVWVQLTVYLVISLALALFASWLPSLRDIFRAHSILGLNMPLSEIVETLFQFLVIMGLFYILARMFRGQGTILTQSYTVLMLSIPLGLLSLVGLALYLIPFAGAVLFWIWFLAWFIYSIVLQIYALMAVHRLSEGKATGVYFIALLLIIIGYLVLPIAATHLH